MTPKMAMNALMVRSLWKTENLPGLRMRNLPMPGGENSQPA
jgi:hypothetical protein